MQIKWKRNRKKQNQTNKKEDEEANELHTRAYIYLILHNI